VFSKVDLIVIIYLVICNSFSVSGQQVKVLEHSDTGLELEFVINQYEIRDVEIAGEVYHYVFTPELRYVLEPGSPLLPYLAESIIIPEKGDFSVEIIEKKSTIINLNKILPRSYDSLKLIPSDKSDLYAGEEVMKRFNRKALPIHTGDRYVFRDFSGIVIYFHPFLFDSGDKQIEIIESLRMKVNFSEGFDESYRKMGQSIASSFQSLYRQHFINYEYLSSKYTPLSDEGDLLIISTEEFLTAVSSLVEWKNRKGIKTDIAVYPYQTGNTPEEIKNYIQNVYDSTGSLVYILIVGDAEDVPPHEGYAGTPGFDADPVYTLLAGNDEYPDAFIGRLSVENLLQAETVIQKNIQYEAFPQPGAIWYRRATGVASDEDFPPIGVDTVIMNRICDSMLAYNYNHFDKIYDPGATAIELIDAVNNGRSWLNYLGHGSPTGWSTTAFSTVHITQLNNAFMNPVVVSVACNTGAFSGITCLAEAWQRVGTPDVPLGSIAFMGSTITHYNSATIGKLEMIQHLVNENFYTVGGIMVNGIMESIDYYPGTGVGSGAECHQSWHLFGDPSLMVFSAEPTEMILNYYTYPKQGDTCLFAYVNDNAGPIKNALVSVYASGHLYGSGYTDESGFADVFFDEPLENIQFVEVVATGYNKMPFMDTLPLSITYSQSSRFEEIVICYPNPLHDKLNFEFDLPASFFDNIEVTVRSSEGIIIRKITKRNFISGSHKIMVGMQDLNSGVYYITLVAGDFYLTKKIIKL
jgi:hypothetical protein